MLQGSILGPLLLKNFNHDIFYVSIDSHMFNVIKYTKVYGFESTINSVIKKLQNDLIELLDWFKPNGIYAGD